MDNKATDLMQAIGTYTDQLERYEDLSTWFAAFIAGCILIVLITAAFLLLGQGTERGRVTRNGILSGLFSVIPALVTLYLYTFAMNMRKVALYRGYISFLERQWNELCGSDLMLFSDKVMGRFFSFQSFLVNGLGPVVMAFFVILALALGFGLSVYFLRRLPASRMKEAMKVLICVVMVVCVLFNGLCVYYLSTNDAVVAQTIAYCEGLAG